VFAAACGSADTVGIGDSAAEPTADVDGATEPVGDETLAPVQPASGCVDEHARYAPATPEGWTRFVLDAAPSGACVAGPYLFMSLVRPTVDDAPPTLATFTVSPLSPTQPDPDGESIVIDGVPAVLSAGTGPDGSEFSSITMHIDAVVVEGHGYIAASLLTELMSSIEALDATTWDELVAETVDDPGGGDQLP
jgi:hypothetical protein